MNRKGLNSKVDQALSELEDTVEKCRQNIDEIQKSCPHTNVALYDNKPFYTTRICYACRLEECVEGGFHDYRFKHLKSDGKRFFETVNSTIYTLRIPHTKPIIYK